MPLKKQKEKNIVEPIKGNELQYQLIPNYKLGEFIFDTSITKYLSGKSYIFYEDLDNPKEGFYAFMEPQLNVYVDSRNIITHITCKKYCFYQNINLIGHVFDNILLPISGVSKVYINENSKNMNQIVYDIDDLGIQIWVYRKKIVTVICSNLNDIPCESLVA